MIFDHYFLRHINLSETSTFFGVEVDVVDPEGGRIQHYARRIVDRRRVSRKVTVAGGREPYYELRSRAEIHDDLDLMILQRNERQRKPRVSVKPEHERNVVNTGAVSIPD